LHALEPGHGKTIVAAYLVGTRGTSRHAVLLGLIVTAAHTAGVYLLGGITLYASRWIVPEQLYPWLGVISGLMIAGLASYLFLRACTGESEAHGHQAGQSHSHWFASLTRSRVVERAPATAPSTAGTLEPADASVPLGRLLTLGITGGMVPCPAALVVLLSALSLHRVGLGLFLIVAFSLGLAAVLIVIGLLMVYARQFMARWQGDGLVSKRWLPAVSSGFMLILGLGIAAKGLLSTGIGSGFLSRGHLVSFIGIVLLGLFLGMRHSTDPDHVVAVSTIVSRERSLRYAALIGMLWGVGHTLTISLVGSATILFNLVIPPRIGLSMELSVAVMLILLGVLNLTGVVRWLTEKFTPPAQSAAQSTAQSRAQSPVRPAAPNATDTAGSSLDRVVGRFGLYQLLRPLVIGLIHGLAGSAAVALLVLSTIHSPLWAIAYLVVFGIGTIAGMMLMTTAIALPIAYTGNRFARAGNYLGVASGIVSTAFGMFLIYQIGLVDGLFTGQAHWIPR
jgi:ABC-type nickel/cobalt efflux system permease component RcnA